ncbi:hypothetical protein [Occallatibacter savannae]|uniref:hypothetical protein n=1 Tax=Occallatibacter savannae TaxID=1002691 RepID=UPI000D6980DC|nr:hypothetical protein [Occallatibacter savannae]
MATLDVWLKRAVRGLSQESAETVRREIEEHFEAARGEALGSSIDPQQAGAMAMQALGDPRVANRQYRKVLLTKSEAKVLRNSNAELRMICSNGWAKWMILSAPGTLLLLSVMFLAMHQYSLAKGILVVGALMAIFFMPPFMPIYTVSRGRIYRAIKWVVMLGSIVLLFGGDSRNGLWLISCCFFPVLYTEWKRMVIRRKLPIGRWPRQLYL